ncbi:ABC transporter permease [Pseudoscardovia suis]|uniref:ABC transporter permease n=1 Tax=Pseudoscardovia suis TaxID=987063 RepID=UPI003F9942BD
MSRHTAGSPRAAGSRGASWMAFLSTLRMELRCTLRNPSAVFWLIAFPCIVATLVQGVFGNIAEQTTIAPATVAVVRDDAWRNSPGADEFINAISGAQQEDADQADDTKTDATTQLIERTNVSTTEQAEQLLDSQQVMAYVSVISDTGNAGDTGDINTTDTTSDTDTANTTAATAAAGFSTRLHLTVSQHTAENIAQASSHGGDGSAWSLIALEALLEQFNTQSTMITQAVTQAITQRIAQTAATDPSKLNDTAWIKSIVQSTTDEFIHTAQSDGSSSYLEPAQGYAAAHDMARYHFAIIAMATFMAMTLACEQITKLQANLSELGARVCVSPLSRLPKIAAVMLSVWLEAFVCLLVDFAYVRFVMHVPINGRDGLAVAALAMAALVTTTLGLALGAVPRLALGTKTGLSIIITLVLSAFTGMFGNMAFADSVQRAAPLLQYLNPCKQVTNLFYDLLYYHSLTPFAHTVLVLACMSTVGLALAVVELRRTSYDNL